MKANSGNELAGLWETRVLLPANFASEILIPTVLFYKYSTNFATFAKL